MGRVVLHRRLDDLPRGALLMVEVLDGGALCRRDRYVPRRTPMPESLVVVDELGAGQGSVIAISEGREAAMPWYPNNAPVDAYCVAILDELYLDEKLIN
jgi:microcompartment protein CcmK/EutM